MRTMNIIIAPTNRCNLNCDYCYNNYYSNRNCEKTIGLEVIEHLLDLVSKEYDYISFVWRGGEPLLCPQDFYKNVISLQNNYSKIYNVQFSNCIQTNGTLITKQWVKFLLKNRIGIGVSYDGLLNDVHRGMGKRTINGINTLKKYKVDFGIISVITKNNSDMINLYEELKGFSRSLKFTPCFSTESFTTDITSAQWIEGVKRLFVHWLNDDEEVYVYPLTEYIRHILGVNTIKQCNKGSCLGNFIDISADGMVRVCAHSNEDSFVLKNIMECSTFFELFDNENFKVLIKKMIQHRSNCKINCANFEYCEGGCCVEALSKTQSSNFSCEATNMLLPFFKEVIATRIRSNTLHNPAFIKILKEAVAYNPKFFSDY